MSENIKCGNSLIANDYYLDKQGSFLDDETHRINAFDWEENFSFLRKGRFDVVIGNPPYDVMEKTRGAASWPHTALSEYVKLHADYEGRWAGTQPFPVLRRPLARIGAAKRAIRHDPPLALLADIKLALGPGVTSCVKQRMS